MSKTIKSVMDKLIDENKALIEERDALLLQLQTEEQNAAHQRHMKAKAREQRDMLVAHIEALTDLAKFWIHQAKPEPDCTKDEYNTWLALGYQSKTLTQIPRQHLRTVQAEAVLNFVRFLPRFHDGMNTELMKLAEKHAESLQKEGQ